MHMIMNEHYNVFEFYRSGETKPFFRSRNIFNIPRVGEEIDIYDVQGIVSTVTWNLDYPILPHEQWRCNIYIKSKE